MSQLSIKMLWILSAGLVILLTTGACSIVNVSFNQEIQVTPSETDLTDQSIINEHEIIVDKAIPEDIVNMLIKHFDAMSSGDAESFKATLVPEDGADLNSEPCSMETFTYYNNTNVYIKKIDIYNQSLEVVNTFDEKKLNYIAEIVVWNPIEQQDVPFFAQISKESGEWGICRYIQEENLQ